MDYQPPAGATPRGAACAVHPDQTAAGICTRCGNFMCLTCSEQGTHEACPTCRAITGEVPGFIWTRSSYSLDGVLSFCSERFKKDWVMLSLAALIFIAVIGAISVVSQVLQGIGALIHPVVMGAFAVAGSLVQAIAQAAITGGVVVLMYDVMKGRPLDLGRMFSQFSNLSTYAVATLLMWAIGLALAVVVAIPAGIGYAAGGETGALIGAGIGGLVAIVPAIWVGLAFWLVEPEIALGGEKSGVQAVTNAFKLAAGQRPSIFLFALVGGLITTGGVLACCVGMLPALALATMLRTGLFLALRNGAGLPPMRGQI